VILGYVEATRLFTLYASGHLYNSNYLGKLRGDRR
jgi:hypothetical protein